MENPTYLGDGAYAEWDGDGIRLMAGSHDNPTDVVYLEPDVLRNLLKWIKLLEILGE